MEHQITAAGDGHGRRGPRRRRRSASRPAPCSSSSRPRDDRRPRRLMTEPIRIANCSGFFGDRLSAAREMVEGGPIDVLTGDWLAELTMLILARIRAKRPGGGFAGTFVTQMEQVMGTCLDRGDQGRLERGRARSRGLRRGRRSRSPTSSGSSPRSPTSTATTSSRGSTSWWRPASISPILETGEPVGDHTRSLTANAYFGCWGIVEALAQGADIVVTGRVTDAAVVCGPAAWHHGWARDDWDALAGGVVAGHVIECGTPGDRRQLLVLHRGAGHGPARLPVGRGRRRRVVGDRQARRHRRARSRSARSRRSCCTRSARPPTSGPTSSPASTRSSSSRSAPDRVRIHGVQRRAAAADAQGGDERARRVPQRHRDRVRPASTSTGRPSSSTTRSGPRARTGPTTSRRS